jgi:hypothetical protein
MTAAKAGADTATQTITAQADAGVPVEQIDRHHQDVAAWLFSEAQDDDARTFAAEYNRQAETLVTELRHLNRPEPDRTPGAEHPDHSGWFANQQGVFVRGAGKVAGQREQRELEAG